jgi:uncharacterized protein YjbI with pentapeptide repeats
MEIRNTAGQLILAYEGELRNVSLDDADLSDANLEQANLEVLFGWARIFSMLLLKHSSQNHLIRKSMGCC